MCPADVAPPPVPPDVALLLPEGHLAGLPGGIGPADASGARNSFTANLWKTMTTASAHLGPCVSESPKYPGPRSRGRLLAPSHRLSCLVALFCASFDLQRVPEDNREEC